VPEPREPDVYLHRARTGSPASTSAPPRQSRPKPRWERRDEPGPRSQPSCDPRTGRQEKLFTWDEIFARARRMASTMVRYLDQLRVSARPSTLSAYDDALRMFAGHITLADPACTAVTAIDHRHIEAHKTWMASRPRRSGRPMSPTTISHRLCLLRTFIERIIAWDYDAAPRRCPISKGGFPERDEPLPKLLDDPTAAKFMAALATDPNRRRRLMVECRRYPRLCRRLPNPRSRQSPNRGRCVIRSFRALAGESGVADRPLRRRPGPPAVEPGLGHVEDSRAERGEPRRPLL
jgi:hypothetical protein